MIAMSLFGEDELPPRKDHISSSDIQKVFDFWVEKHYTRGPKPQMSNLRRTRIQKALRSHGMETTLRAIRGCANSDWHMGHNPRGQKYNDISLILRDAGYIEKFAALADDGDDVGDFLRDW